MSKKPKDFEKITSVTKRKGRDRLLTPGNDDQLFENTIYINGGSDRRNAVTVTASDVLLGRTTSVFDISDRRNAVKRSSNLE
jgi:hypothetical protein